jgi:tRNA dimethylallyltransferase
MEQQRLVVIVGPTASGKTGLGIELARQIGGEVISADSRQVYRGLNIGTEKVTKRETRGVPHHCVDIASPRRAFSVEQWRRHAVRAIRGIVRRGKVPILVGGTGWYVDALVYGITLPNVPPDHHLRARLAKLSPQELFPILHKLDPVRAETVEQKNPRRLIRAIEIATARGAVPVLQYDTPAYDVLWTGLNPGLEILEERITKRLEQSMRRGLVTETKALRSELHLSTKRIEELGLEYRTVDRFLQGNLSKEDLQSELLVGLRRYAKRQMTWFKRNKNIIWYTDPDNALRDLLLRLTPPR